MTAKTRKQRLRMTKADLIEELELADDLLVEIESVHAMQKRAEKALSQKSQILGLALNSIDQGFVVWSEDDCLIICNDRYGELWGYPEELLKPGTSHFEILEFRAQSGAFGEGDPQELAQARYKQLSALRTQGDEFVTTPHGLLVRCRYIDVEGFGFVITYTDITDLKQMEETLRENEERYIQAANIAKLGHWVWDEINDKCISCSDGLARLHGVSVAEYIEISNSTDNIVGWAHLDDRERFSQIMEKFVKQHIEYDIEYRIVARDGTLRHVHEIGNPVFDDDGVHILTQGIMQDITENKLAEEAVRVSEERLRIALETMTGGIFMINKDMIIQVMSPDFSKLYDIPEELCQPGASLRDVIHYRAKRGDYGSGDPNFLSENRCQEYSDRKLVRSESKLHNDQIIEVFRTPTKDGGAVVVYNDITERKETEDALKLSEARYQAVVEDQTEVITRFTPDGIFTFANEAFCRFVGKKQEALIGTSIYNDLPEEVIPGLKDLFKSLTQEHPRQTNENNIINTDGELRYFDWSNSATLDEQGNITEILSVGRDITERKQAEAALQESEQLLQKQVVELKYSEERLEAQAIDLIALAEDLEAAKQEMQHMANHDALTGLPSLRLCNDRLKSALAVDRRNKSQTAVLFVDLDGFKAVNDSLGHEAGDMVLKGVADRLKSSVREVDTVARIGGDEFILVLPETGDKDNIAIVAKKIIAKLSEPFTVDTSVANIGASIGIAISPADGVTAEELLRHADESMYVIKKKGKNSYGFFA